MKRRPALVILAGGQGARLGGQDKGLLWLDGKTLVEQLLLRFSGQVADVWIIANRNLAAYRRLAAPFGAQVIADVSDGFQGPLMGMLTGLVHASAEQILVVPCDAAQLPPDLLRRLQQHQQQTQTRAVFAAVGVQDYPVCCLLQRALLTHLEQAFVAGERSPARWLAAIGAARCDFGAAGQAACWSVNTPDELERARVG